MQKNKIKARKLRRKAHDIMLLGTTVFMFGMAIVSALLHAFHKPSLLYTVMFLISFGWLAVFTLANGGVEE